MFVFSDLQQSLSFFIICTYSSVPNRRAVRNNRAGGKILKKTLNVQGRIDVQGGKST